MSNSKQPASSLQSPKTACYRGSLLASACLVLAGVLTPTAASGSSAPEKIGRKATMTLAASRGYRMDVQISDRAASLAVSWGHSGVLYRTVEAKVVKDRFEARFGRMGEINMTFSPQRGRQVDTAQSECIRRIRGRFVGRLHFRGEQRFTAVDRRVVQGVESVPGMRQRTTCRNAERVADRTAGPSSAQVTLQSVSFPRRRLIVFRIGDGAIQALRTWEGEGGIGLGLGRLEGKEVAYSALSVENRHGLHIVRFAAAIGGRRSARMSAGGRAVIVAPPSPFAGSAEYRPCALKRWKGLLRVAFPGLEQSLVTREFASVLTPAVPCS